MLMIFLSSFVSYGTENVVCIVCKNENCVYLFTY